VCVCCEEIDTLKKHTLPHSEESLSSPSRQRFASFILARQRRTRNFNIASATWLRDVKAKKESVRLALERDSSA
jgi:hypothetical protein